MNNNEKAFIGVIGCGVMGQGIIQTLVTTAHPVMIHDTSREMMKNAVSQITKRINRMVEKEKITSDEARKAIDRINLIDELEKLNSCEIIIEAVYENLDLKLELFQNLEKIVPDRTILASNTSSLLIASIARKCRLPERVAGMHFFNPVPIMKLVEIVAGPATAEHTIEKLMSLSVDMGKLPVKVKDAPGFLVNFGGRAYTTEAMRLLHERIATPSQIDYIMRHHAGFKMGPLELADLTGIDVNYPVTQFIYDGYIQDPRIKTSFPHLQLFEAGRFGQKTRNGSYHYDADGNKKDVDPLYLPRAQVAPRSKVIVSHDHLHIMQCLKGIGFEVISQDDGISPIIVELYGEDCSTYAEKSGFDYKRIIGVDILFRNVNTLTLMTPPGRDSDNLDGFVAALMERDIRSILIKDSPGFVAQRITAMIANLGCEMAHIGIASPIDIDQAMRVGLNYPYGPLEWAEQIGITRCYEIMCNLQAITGDDRYRPSQWLRQRAILDLPIHTSED